MTAGPIKLGRGPLAVVASVGAGRKRSAFVRFIVTRADLSASQKMNRRSCNFHMKVALGIPRTS